jgi:hypothetical protein
MCPIEVVSSQQSESQSLPLKEKIVSLNAILQLLASINLDTYIAEFGYSEIKVIGVPSAALEGQCQALENVFFYISTVQKLVQLYIHAYQFTVDDKTIPLNNLNALNGQTMVQTSPAHASDKFGPFREINVQVWLEPGKELQAFDHVKYFLNQHYDGIRLVLGAGNHCFLTAADVLHGLFY